MPNKIMIESFNNLYSKFSQINFDFFYKEKFGELSLKNELEPTFKDIEEKLNKIQSIISFLSDSQIANAIEKYEKFLNTLVTYSRGNEDNFIKNRSQIISNIIENHNEIINIWPSYSAIYSEFKLEKLETPEELQSDFKNNANLYIKELERLQFELKLYQQERANLETELVNVKSKSAKDAEQISILRTQLTQQLNDFQERISPILKTGEILKQQEIFIKTAKGNRRDSIYWIVLIVIFSGILILVTANLINNAIPDLSKLFNDSYLDSHKQYQKDLFFYSLVKKTLATILFLSILAFILKFCIRNYNSLMHNYTVNIQKANSFAASLNLIHNAFDNEKKDEILNLAAKEIFSQHKTGYLSKDYTSTDLTQLDKIINMVYKTK